MVGKESGQAINDGAQNMGLVDGKQVAEESKPESLIDRHSRFSGHYCSTHNLRVDGASEGQIECQGTLTVAEQAKVKAKVIAQNVIVAGNLEGDITCPGRFQILATGRVLGTVVAGSLDIRAGAIYEGSLSMHGQLSQPFSEGENGKAGPGAGTPSDQIRPNLTLVPTATATTPTTNGGNKTAG